jgi:hypothetical protein
MITALEKSKNDQVESFKVINHLLSGFRGSLEFQRFLQGFSHPSFDANIVARIEKILAKIDRWATNLLGGEVLISHSWNEPETFEAHEAISCLQTLLTDLTEVASSIEQILRMRTHLTALRDAQFVAAAVAKASHANYFFLLNVADAGPLIGIPEAAQNAAAILEDSYRDVEMSVGMFGYLSEAETLDPTLANQIAEFAAPIPPLLRTQAHESLLLASYFEPMAITYERVGIAALDQSRWEISGIPPREAGYWHARGISPEEAIAWKLGGITTAASAFEWSAARFTPSSATPWAEKGLRPSVAAQWARDGYKPDIALAYIDKGIAVPSVIPGRR